MHDDRHAEQPERVQHDHAQRFRAANEAYGILGDGELCCSWRSSADVHHGGPTCDLKPAVRYFIEQQVLICIPSDLKREVYNHSGRTAAGRVRASGRPGYQGSSRGSYNAHYNYTQQGTGASYARPPRRGKAVHPLPADMQS